MTAEPHPQRCGTCDFYDCGMFVDKCKGEIFPDNMDSTERQYIRDWIISHGCASHSSAKSEREGVLICNDKTCFAIVLFELQELLHYINPESPAGYIISRRYNEIWKLREQL